MVLIPQDCEELVATYACCSSFSRRRQQGDASGHYKKRAAVRSTVLRVKVKSRG